MKILFLCGSLEAGKDGVGDYTRRLSEELSRSNHAVFLIAINDRFIKTTKENVDILNEEQIPFLRLPSSLSYSERFQLVEKKIKEFDPEWISLQYVPYSFHRKGLPWCLSRKLRAVGKNKKWHIMFHELWVGINIDSTLRHKIIGKLQENIVKNMIDILRPKVINTQSSVYKETLKRKGIIADYLPLFSNIPKSEIKAKKRNKDQFSFVVFGKIQPHAPFALFLDELVHLQEQEKKKFQFIFVGRSGDELEKWISICEEKNFKLKVLGEQEPAKISEILYKADWGISSTPFYQCEKSGTIAAMLDHQLPVYCVARSWKPWSLENLSLPQSVKNYEPNNLNLKYMPMETFNNEIGRITSLFSDYLLNYQKK